MGQSSFAGREAAWEGWLEGRDTGVLGLGVWYWLLEVPVLGG